MLDFAEQTGSGILIAVWSFLMTDITCNIQSHIIYLYAYLYFHAHIRVHISNIHAMVYNITHVCDLHASPSAYKEEVSLLSCNSYYTQCSDKAPDTLHYNFFFYHYFSYSTQSRVLQTTMICSPKVEMIYVCLIILMNS